MTQKGQKSRLKSILLVLAERWLFENCLITKINHHLCKKEHHTHVVLPNTHNQISCLSNKVSIFFFKKVWSEFLTKKRQLSNWSVACVEIAINKNTWCFWDDEKFANFLEACGILIKKLLQLSGTSLASHYICCSQKFPPSHTNCFDPCDHIKSRFDYIKYLNIQERPKCGLNWRPKSRQKNSSTGN